MRFHHHCLSNTSPRDVHSSFTSCRMTASRIYILIDTPSYTQHTLSYTRIHVTIHFHTLAIHSPYTYDTFGYALRYTSISSTYTLRYTQHTLAIHFHTLSYTLQNTSMHFHTLSYTFIHFHTLSYTFHTLFIHFSYTFIHFTIHFHTLYDTPSYIL